MTVHDHPERVRAQARGDLAERLVPVAAELAARVRDEDRQSLGDFLAQYTRAERDALLIVVAAMVDVDRTPAELLAHVTFDEFGQVLDGAAPALPRCSTEPEAEPEAGSRLPARERNLQTFAELRAQGLRPEQAAVRMGKAPRTGWRYEQSLREQQGEAAAS